VNVWFRRCTSFEEEAEADREFWLQYSPDERVALVEGPAPEAREFAPFFQQREVRALVVGVHAIAFHAKPRHADHVDILVEACGDAASIPNHLNLMTSIDGLTFEEAWRSRVEGTFGGVPAFFIGKEALIRNKTAAGRAQDLADLELLRRF
jgi:hypothetical protein